MQYSPITNRREIDVDLSNSVNNNVIFLLTKDSLVTFIDDGSVQGGGTASVSSNQFPGGPFTDKFRDIFAAGDSELDGVLKFGLKFFSSGTTIYGNVLNGTNLTGTLEVFELD